MRRFVLQSAVVWVALIVYQLALSLLDVPRVMSRTQALWSMAALALFMCSCALWLLWSQGIRGRIALALGALGTGLLAFVSVNALYVAVPAAVMLVDFDANMRLSVAAGRAARDPLWSVLLLIPHALALALAARVYVRWSTRAKRHSRSDDPVTHSEAHPTSVSSGRRPLA